MYNHKSNQAYLSLILLDNQNAREYIISILKEYIPNLYVFNTDNQEFNLKKFTNKLKTTPTVISNLDKFYLNLSLEKEITINEAKELFYQAINLCRDSIFLEYNSIFFMFLNDEDYYHLMVSANDFFSYCKYRLNFNECFINNEDITLDNYYKQKQLKKLPQKR